VASRKAVVSGTVNEYHKAIDREILWKRTDFGTPNEINVPAGPSRAVPCGDWPKDRKLNGLQKMEQGRVYAKTIAASAERLAESSR